MTATIEPRTRPLRGRHSAPHLLVVASVVLATTVTIEAGARLILYWNDNWRADYRVEADGYAGATWTRAYYKELRVSSEVDWHPYIYWRRRPFTGSFINIDRDGIRRSWQPPAVAADDRALFVMGGSTVWGTGARDEETLPSHLARELAAHRHPVRVVNYAESGYVVRQSLAMLIDRLQRGDVPALVVFYGGMEDTFSAFQNGEPGLPQNEENRRLEFNVSQPQNIGKTLNVMVSGIERLGSLARSRLVPSDSGDGSAPDQTALAESVAASYCQTGALAAALGREYGFSTLFYWQPVLFTKLRPTAYESRIRGQYAYARDFFAKVYRRVEAIDACRLIGLRNLSGLFDQDPQPAYLDAFHLTERGNAIVAHAITPDLADALDRRALAASGERVP